MAVRGTAKTDRCAREVLGEDSRG
uniref:Uncharacterized protein n=1 Tax=Arundo donax TaxID=35708 RepID=A0A0A8XVK4_ARUDO